MTARDEAITAFLAASGFGAARREPVPGDASFRRYERLRGGPVPAMLMDAPVDKGEDCRPFVAIARHLTDLGLSAPGILAADLDQGLLLLEDLGDDLFARVVAREDEGALYACAVDALGVLRRPVPERLGDYVLPRYDAREFHREADLLIDWYWPLLTGRPLPEADRAAWRDAWAPLWDLARSGPEVLVLRDYHAENLFWLPDRAGPRRVGLIDFQDGLIGDAAYDLVSLLEDARRDVAPALAEAMIARYVAANPVDPDAFRLAFDILAAQRNAKIIGIFARLSERDGKRRYLSLIPRVMALFERDLARRDRLAPVRAVFDRLVPEAARRGAPVSRRAPS